MSSDPLHPEKAPTAPAAVAEPGLLGILIATFVRPEEMGQSVARRGLDGRAAAAFLIVLLAVVAGAVWTLPQLVDFTVDQLRSTPGVPPEAVASFERVYQSGPGRAILVVMPALAVLLGVPLTALLLWGGQLAMAGRAPFGAVFAVTTFACTISLGLGSLVRSALVVLKDSVAEVSTGLGVFALDRPLDDPLRALLDGFDVFILWAVWSVGVALAAPSGLTRGTALGVSFAVFALLTVIQIAFRLLGAMMAQ